MDDISFHFLSIGKLLYSSGYHICFQEGGACFWGNLRFSNLLSCETLRYEDPDILQNITAVIDAILVHDLAIVDRYLELFCEEKHGAGEASESVSFIIAAVIQNAFPVPVNSCLLAVKTWCSHGIFSFRSPIK